MNGFNRGKETKRKEKTKENIKKKSDLERDNQVGMDKSTLQVAIFTFFDKCNLLHY